MKEASNHEGHYMNAAFAKATIERAVKTFCQVLVTFLGVDLLDIRNVQWEYGFGIAATAAAVSVLTSIASSGVGSAGPSLTSETLTPGA